MPEPERPPTPFESATQLRPLGDGQSAWSVPDGWQQGRGAWGGLVVAAAVRAVQAVEPDRGRTVRTVSAQIMTPALVGGHRLAVQPVRIGSAMSTWSVSLTTDAGEPVAQAVVITGAPRATVAADAALAAVEPPVAAAPDDAVRVPAGPLSPVFMQHLHMRLLEGMPLSGSPASTLGWLGYDEPPEPDAASLLALVDGWWPASLPALSQVPRLATVNFTANLLLDPGTIDRDRLLVSQTFVSAASDGFTSEHRRLWTADGRLAVDNLQTIVLST